VPSAPPKGAAYGQAAADIDISERG